MLRASPPSLARALRCVLLAIGLVAAGACRASMTPPSAPVSLSVALCQTEVDPDPEVNFARLDAALAEAAERGAALACFPETCLFGWLNPAAHEEADPVPGATTARLAALARRHGLMLAVGLAERAADAAGRDRLHDSAVLVDADGSLLLLHRKVNVIEGLMDPPYTAGAGPGEDAAAENGWVAETRLGRIGLLICADTFEDVLVDAVADEAPDLVLVPYGWAAPSEAWPEHGASLGAWVAHTARRCRAPVVGVDATGRIHAGPWEGYVLGGQSLACDAAGEVLVTLADRAPEVRVVDLVPASAALRR